VLYNIKQQQLILSINKQKVKNYLKKGNQPYGVAKQMTEYIYFWLAKNVAELIALAAFIIVFIIGCAIYIWYTDRDTNG
jgi:ABC-type multidrug transport system fused ATPase/permease subunit